MCGNSHSASIDSAYLKSKYGLQDLLGGVIAADPNFAFPDGQIEANRVGFPGLLGDPGTERALQLLDKLYDEVGACMHSLQWIQRLHKEKTLNGAILCVSS